MHSIYRFPSENTFPLVLFNRISRKRKFLSVEWAIRSLAVWNDRILKIWFCVSYNEKKITNNTKCTKASVCTKIHGKIDVKIVLIVIMICVRSSDQHRSTNKPGLKHTHFVLWMKCLPTESATPPTTLWSLFTYFFFFLLLRSFSLSLRHSFALSYTLCLCGL